VLLLLVGVALAAGLGGVLFSYARSRHISRVVYRPARAIANTDVNPYGANFFLAREVEVWKREKTLEMARQAGIGWAKQQFPWEAIERRGKGIFTDAHGESTWRKFDEIIALYEKYGLEIVARLDRPPDWTRQDNRFKERPPDNFEDYGDFVYAFVNRYKGRVRYIQIWNEPNIFPEWGDREVDPAGYVELLKIAYRRAKEADPDVYVLSAPLAINTEDFPARRNLSDLIYLEEMYQAGAKDTFDILSANAFGMDQPPDASPDPQVLNFSRVLLQRQIMEKYGDGDKAVWFNEYGWNASPSDFPPEQLIWKRVSEEDQARYTVEGIKRARSQWPWAGVFFIWYFRQVGNIPPDRSDYYFRMVDVDFRPRLVYHAVREATRGLDVAGPGYYEETHPAVQVEAPRRAEQPEAVATPTPRRWRAVISPEASGGALLESRTPGAALTFVFAGNRVALVAETGPEGCRLVVTLDGRPVAGLPRDEKGRSFLELYSTERWPQRRVPVVAGVGSGQHALRLEVVEESPAPSSGRRCTVDAFEVRSVARGTFPYAAVGALVLALLAVGWLLRERCLHQNLGRGGGESDS